MSEMRTIEKLLRQQAALADFGSFAFRESDLEKILTEAARICAQSLGVPFAKICRYRVAENDLLVVAGCGWHAGVVGYVISEANESSTQGRAFITGEAVILEDIAKNGSFHLPPFYAEHGIVATADVLIKGRGDPWGVLEVDSEKARKFDEHDVVFLTGFANVVAEAVTTVERAAVLHAAFERMELAVAEKDRLLAERLVRELRLREMQAQLLHLTRVNAMGQMSAAIAHELNQPLAAIVNYVGAAQRTLSADNLNPVAIARTMELIGKVRDLTLRAGAILQNIRGLVQKRDSSRALEDINQVVTDAATLVLFGVADEGISVTFDLDTSLLQVLIDKIQIQQVLINLVRNSIEAMRSTATRNLFIATGPGKAGFVDVTVQDTGPGLPSAIVEQLFLPFHSTKDDGMGLGLMICQTLVEANGGRIWHVEDLAVGTGFRFSLPLAPPAKIAEVA